jgi:hypothetical protein
MKKRYKLRKEQLERIVESFISEAAAPEATKHLLNMPAEGSKKVVKIPGTKSVPENDTDGIDDVSQAPEAKKHIKNKDNSRKVELPKGVKVPAEKPIAKKKKVAPEAKKHIKQK